jgi:hypothetical protein
MLYKEMLAGLSADEVDWFWGESVTVRWVKETGVLCLHNSLSEGIRLEAIIRVRSHAPSIQSHRGTKVESQKNRFALIYFGKIQFLPPCIWNLPFMSAASEVKWKTAE